MAGSPTGSASAPLTRVQRPLERDVVRYNLVVLRGDVARDRGGIAALVEARILELDRVGVDALARHHARGGGGEQRRVETAAREHAHRNVRHQLALDGPEQDLAHLMG